MAQPALELRNVSKFYGDFCAVNDLSLTVPTGCIYGFLGPNGAGKTTSLRMILDILRPTSGSIRVSGGASIPDPISNSAVNRPSANGTSS